MQTGPLKLREIIWEITGKCCNKCLYCGSKDQWSETIDEERVLDIAKRIAAFPPEAIDISGGDPLLISYNTHALIVSILQSKGVQVKILVNPKSLNVNSSKVSSKVDILKLYNWIGLSVNTEEELELAKVFKKDFPSLGITIISNFNVANLYMFDHIKDFAKRHKMAWQIQMTMTDSQLLAIYKSDLATKALFDKIQEALNQGVQVIPADNLNSGSCGAGTSSMGILADGRIVPCLSMRSWVEDINTVVVDNILETPLELVWKTSFLKERFEEFKCCKDECGNKCFQPGLNKNQRLDALSDWVKKGTVPKQKHQTVMVYGVFPQSDLGQSMLYSVTRGDFNSSSETKE